MITFRAGARAEKRGATGITHPGLRWKVHTLMFTTQITITGNVVEEIDLTYTPSGTAVAQFRLASTDRYQVCL